MQDVEGPDKLTVDEGSWFASISFIATLVGCFTCGPLMDAIGRKRTLLVVNSPFIVGWFLMWMAPKPAPVVLLYFARLFTGLGGGMISIPANIYIAEMASSSMRCMLVTWPSIAISIGILLIYALGLVTDSWRIIAAISTFVPIVTAVFIAICIRESPIWLAGRFRVEEAEKNFRYLSISSFFISNLQQLRIKWTLQCLF
ncbi:hypothetical protein C0J52_10454 [Blattella germanica]|nr:hypothetical protein C0J52_10454 [Blattella germanica]